MLGQIPPDVLVVQQLRQIPWTLRDLIASGDLPAVRPPRLRRVWIDRADLDRAIADWKERGAG